MQTFGWPEILFILRSAGWTLALTAIAFFIGSILSLGFTSALFLSTAMFVIAWYVGREVDED